MNNLIETEITLCEFDINYHSIKISVTIQKEPHFENRMVSRKSFIFIEG